MANSSRKLAKNPLTRRNTSLSNELILCRDTCCRCHFHRGFALNTTRSHDQRQVMLEYAAVTLAPANLLCSLDTCCPQVNTMCGEYLCKHSPVMHSAVTGDTKLASQPRQPSSPRTWPRFYVTMVGSAAIPSCAAAQRQSCLATQIGPVPPVPRLPWMSGWVIDWSSFENVFLVCFCWICHVSIAICGLFHSGRDESFPN